VDHRNFTRLQRPDAMWSTDRQRLAPQSRRPAGETETARMRMAKALRIMIETATPRCDGDALAPLRSLAAHAPPLLALPVEDCAGAPGVLATLPPDMPACRHELADALRRACSAALERIPPIDHLPTRSRAKEALRAVAAMERLADALQGRRAA
jgi:hypothetical protein